MPQETGERGSGGGTSEFKMVTPGHYFMSDMKIAGGALSEVAY
jgi:hypothetical protein